MLEILALLQPIDVATGARVDVRLCSSDDRRITDALSERWWPAITRRPSLGLNLFDGDFSGQISTGNASMDVSGYGLKKADASAPARAWAGAPVTLWAIDPAVGTPVLIFRGLVERARNVAESISIDMRVNTEPFVVNALTAFYGGGGGEEGPIDLAGKIKPLLLGRCFNAEPALIDVVNNVYQFSSYGPIESIEVLYERASAFGASTGDHANYAALVAASIPAGQWATCLAQGMFRLGAPAYGVITGDVRGDKPGGVWLRKTGEIITRLCSIAGVPSGSIDAASLAALDTAQNSLPNQGRIGIYLTDQTRLLDLVQRLVRPCNAAAGISTDGKLFVCRTVFGSAGVTFDAQGRQRPAVSGVGEESVSPPYWRIQMQGARNWRVQTDAEIAQGYLPAGEVAYADQTTAESLKPASAAATRNDDGGGNLIAAPRDTATWALFGGASQPGTTLASTMNGLVVQMPSAGAGVIWHSGIFTVTPGELLSFRHIVTCDASVPADAFVVGGFNFFDRNGTILSAPDDAESAEGSEVNAAQAFNVVFRAEGRALVPGGAAFARAYTIRTGGAGGSFYANQAWAGRSGIGADVTGAALPGLAQGAWESGRLYPVGSVVQFGAATYTARVSHTSSGGNAPPTASIWRNLVTVSDSAAAASVGFTTGSTSYGIAAAQFDARAGSTGNVDLSTQMAVQADSNNTADYGAAGKWQRETSPGTWADIGSEQLTATNAFPGGPDSTLDVNATSSGLTAGTLYSFRLMLRRAGAGPGTDTVTMTGQAIGNGR